MENESEISSVRLLKAGKDYEFLPGDISRELPELGEAVLKFNKAMNQLIEAASLFYIEKEDEIYIKVESRYYHIPRDFFELPGVEGVKVDPLPDVIKVVSRDKLLISCRYSMDGQLFEGFLALSLDNGKEDTKRGEGNEISDQSYSVDHDLNETAELLSLFHIEELLNKGRGETDGHYEYRLELFKNVLTAPDYWMTEILENCGVDLQKFDLRTILLFGAYYLWLKDANERAVLFDTLKRNDEKFVGLFMAGFEVCEFDPTNGELIMSLLDRKGDQGSMEILHYFNHLCDFASYDERMNGSCSERLLTQYYIRTKKTAARMLLHAIEQPDDESFRSFLERTRKYLQENIFIGAHLSDVLDRAREEGLPPERAGELDECGFTLLNVIRGGGLIKSAKREDMYDVDNYQTTEIGPAHYEMIERNMAIYDETEPTWKKILLDTFARDLKNPDMRLLKLEVKGVKLDDGRDVGPGIDIAAVIKVKPDPEGRPDTYYIGTLYVDPIVQQYGLAEYLQGDIESLIEREFSNGRPYVYWGAVSICNVSMQRHVEKAGGCVTGFVRESSNGLVSNDLFRVQFKGFEGLVTKGFNRSMIRVLCAERDFRSSVDQNGNCFIAMKRDSNPDARPELVKELQGLFDDGFIVTRYFYNFVNGEPDLGQTYIVLEKQSISPVIPSQSDQ